MKRIGLVVLALIFVCTSVFAAGQREEAQPVREIVFASQSFSYCMAGANAFKDHVERETDGAVPVAVWAPKSGARASDEADHQKGAA